MNWHNWHDRVFALGAIILSIAFMPSVYGKIHAPLWTAVLTAVTLGVFAVNYGLMRYRFAAAMVAIEALLWIPVIVRAT